MKFLVFILFSFLTASIYAQPRDTIYIDSSKNLVMKDAGLAANRSLVLMDGKAYAGLLKDIDITTIARISVLKPGEARQTYGETAKNGAIIITTNNIRGFIPDSNPPDEKKVFKSDPGNKPLIVTDGVLYEGNFDDIDPKEILSIDSLDNPGATNIYGEKGKNGVVLITTLKQGRHYCQRKLSGFSLAYRVYLEVNNHDDSGLIYLLDGVTLSGSQSDIIKGLYKKIENIEAVFFIEKLSEKPDTSNKNPMVVITTNK
jgi:hypothetical protein